MKRIFIAGAFILFVAIVQAQNVGIGVPVPLQKLDVNGAIRMGNTGTSNAGTLRYSSGRFEGYNGSTWNWLNGFKLPLDTSVDVAAGYVFIIRNTSSLSVKSSAIAGITDSPGGTGLYGENTSIGNAAPDFNTGVLGKSINVNGIGVRGININGFGVWGDGGQVGVQGTGPVGVWGLNSGNGIAVKASASGSNSTGLLAEANSSGSTMIAALIRHSNINGRALIVQSGFVGIGESDPTALLSVKGSEVTANGLAAAITLENEASPNKWHMRAGGPGTITPNGGFSIADNTDYRLVIGATGNIGITGFTQLGKTTEGAPVIKMKKLTTTSAELQTGSVTIAHNLTRSKILSVSVLLTYLANTADIPASYLDVPGYEYNWQVNNNDVWIINKNGNSANILNKPIRILITYEE